MAHLILAGGERAGRSIELHAVTCVGRALDMDIRIDDPAVAERHARLLCGNDGRYLLEDLASAVGTFVNGTKVTSEWLSDADEIRIGKVTFVFHEDPSARGSREPAAVETDEERAAEPGLLREALYAAPVAAESVAWAQELLEAAAETGESIFVGLDEDGILGSVLDRAFEAFPETDRAAVVLRQKETGELRPGAVRVVEGAEQDWAPGMDKALLDYVLEKKQAVLTADAACEDGPGKPGEREGGLALRSVMCAPLLSGDEVIGFILAETRRKAETYVAEGLRVLAGLAGHAGAAIADARLRP